jgi:hypothetical protein
MAKITVECSNPNDLSALEAAVEQAAGRCNITYFKQHEALVDAGKSTSQRDSARKIAEETGESPAAVESRIRRGKDQVRQPDAVRLEREKARKAEGEEWRKKNPPSPLMVGIDGALYISALEKCIRKLPQKPPQQWNERELTRATALAKIIVRRLSEFSVYDQEGMRVTCPHCNKTHVIPWADVENALLKRESKNK